MTTTADAGAFDRADDPTDSRDRLNRELIRQMRLMHLLRTQLGAFAPAGLDWSAYSVLIHLVKDGPKRQGELAECALLDPSTVSRRVQQLVTHGFVERRIDPADGRAVQLVASAAGQALFDGMATRRRELMERVLTGWPEEDVEALLRLLHRFNDGVEAVLPLLPHVLDRKENA